MMQASRGGLFRYGFAVLITIGALLLSFLTHPLIQQNPFLWFFGSIALAAWYGGLGPGLLASLLAILASDYYFLSPIYEWSLLPADLLRLGMFSSVALLINYLANSQRTSKEIAATQGSWFRTTLSSIGDAVVATDANAHIMFLNPVAQTLTGWKQAEANGKPIGEIFNIINEQTRAPVENPIERVLREGIVLGLANHTVLLSRDGRELPIDDSGAPIRDEDGEILGAVLIFRDISARRRSDAEKAALAEQVQQERTHLTDIMRTVPGVVWESWGQPGTGTQRTDFVSDYVETLVGYTKAEWLNTPNFWTNSIHLEDRERIIAESAAHFKSGQKGLLRFRWLAKDGRPIWVETQTTVIKDAAGNPQGIRGITLDITQQKLAEDRERFLADASKILSSSLDFETILKNLAQLAVPAIGDWCVIDVVGSDGLLKPVALTHTDPQKIALAYELRSKYPTDPNAQTGTYRVLHTGQSEIYPDIPDEMLVAGARDEEHLRLIRSIGFSSALTVALKAHGAVLGVLSLVASESGRHFGPDDLAFAEDLANRAALAVENSRLYDEVRQQREQLQVTLASIGDAVIATDPTGNVTFMNAVAQDLTGWTQEEAATHTLTEVFNIINEESRQPVESPFVKVIREGQVVGLANHTLLISRQGKEIPIDDSGAPIKDEKGAITGVILVFRDITERKRTEITQRFLAESSAVLASSLDYQTTLASVARLAVPHVADWCSVHVVEKDGSVQRVAIAHIDPAKLVWAEEMQRRFPPDPNAPTGLYQVIRSGKPEFYPQITDAMLVASVQTPEQLQIAREIGFTSAITVPMIARDRTIGAIQFVTTESRTQYDADDLALAQELARRAAIAVDNARLYREAQEARQAAEHYADRTARLQSVTGALAGIVNPAEVAHVIVEQNIAALPGAYSALVAILTDKGKTLQVLDYAGYRDIAERWKRMSIDDVLPITDVVRSGSAMFLDTPDAWNDGYPDLPGMMHSESMALFPLMTDGKAIGAMAVSFNQQQAFGQPDRAFMLALAQQCAQALHRALLYDAERSARAQSEAALRIRDEFLSVAAHELKTPVTSLRGFAQTITRQLNRGDTLDPVRVGRALEAINEQSVKLTVLISQLLDISRIESGRLTLDRADCDLTELVTGIVAQAQGNTSRHTLTLRAQPAVHAEIDPLRIEQVINNLLDNAIKYSPEGGAIDVALSAVGNGTVRLSVEDRGLGIPAEHRERIFERFYQVHTNSLQGMGLGLYISRQIIDLHNGVIEAEYPAEGGTRFVVILPQKAAETSAENDRSSAAKEGIS